MSSFFKRRENTIRSGPFLLSLSWWLRKLNFINVTAFFLHTHAYVLPFIYHRDPTKKKVGIVHTHFHTDVRERWLKGNKREFIVIKFTPYITQKGVYFLSHTHTYTHTFGKEEHTHTHFCGCSATRTFFVTHVFIRVGCSYISAFLILSDSSTKRTFLLLNRSLYSFFNTEFFYIVRKKYYLYPKEMVKWFKFN